MPIWQKSGSAALVTKDSGSVVMQAALLRLKLTRDCTLYPEWQHYKYLAGKRETLLLWTSQNMMSLVTGPFLVAALEARPMTLLREALKPGRSLHPHSVPLLLLLRCAVGTLLQLPQEARV